MENVFKQMHQLVTKKNRNSIAHFHIIQVIGYFYNLFSISFKHLFCIRPVSIACLPTVRKS